jgi:hypothetical protein
MAKTSKKTARKTVAKKSTANARTKFADSAKITVKFPDNVIPAREETGRYERLALLKKHNGKTVASFVEHDGRLATLSRAVANGWASVR